MAPYIYHRSRRGKPFSFPDHSVEILLHTKNNKTFSGTLLLESGKGDTPTTQSTEKMNTPHDGKGAIMYTVAVILVYGLSIAFLIASQTCMRRKRKRDKEEMSNVNRYLEQQSSLREMGKKDSFRKLKLSIIPLVGIGIGRDISGVLQTPSDINKSKTFDRLYTSHPPKSRHQMLVPESPKRILPSGVMYQSCDKQNVNVQDRKASTHHGIGLGRLPHSDECDSYPQSPISTCSVKTIQDSTSICTPYEYTISSDEYQSDLETSGAFSASASDGLTFSKPGVRPADFRKVNKFFLPRITDANCNNPYLLPSAKTTESDRNAPPESSVQTNACPSSQPLLTDVERVGRVVYEVAPVAGVDHCMTTWQELYDGKHTVRTDHKQYQANPTGNSTAEEEENLAENSSMLQVTSV